MARATLTKQQWAPSPGQLESVRERLLKKHEGETIGYTTCSANGCLDACLLKVHYKDGKMRAIETDDTINVGSGREDAYTPFESFKQELYQRRACPRGRGWRQDVYSPNRILYPMKRVGERGLRDFKRISWDEALDTAAGWYLKTREKYGPHSIWSDGIMGITKDEFSNYMPGGGLGGWAIDSNEPHDFADIFNFGIGLSIEGIFGHNYWTGAENPTFFDSKLILLWGFDACLNYPENLYYLLLAKERGVPIIVIEPRYTWTAQSIGTQYIPIRPGTDTAMILAMADVMFREDSINHEFVDKFVEPIGLAKWRRYILGEDDNCERTPEWAAPICGVPAETIRELARLYARSTPCYTRMVWAATRNLYGENPARAHNMLAALGGNIGAKGTNGIGVGLGVKPHIPIPANNYGSKPPTYPPQCFIEAEKWGSAILLHKKVESGELSEREYKEEIGCPVDGPTPNIHMIMSIHNTRNLAMNYYDMNERIAALNQLDYHVYGHWNFQNNTTWYADLLLPYSHQYFEGNFTLYGPFTVGLNNVTGNYFIYGSREFIRPPGETAHWYWVKKEIGKRLGIGDVFLPRLKDVAREDMGKVMEEISRESYEKWANRADMAKYNPPSWDEFLKKPIFRIPIGDYKVKLMDEFEKNTPLKTPSGKIEPYSDFLANADLTRAVHTGSKCFGKGHIAPMAVYRHIPEGFFDSKVVKFPLYMITPHSYYRQHSCQDDNKWFRDEYRNSVWISVPDAKARGIKDGDLVLVFNDVGQVLVNAYVTSRLTPGVTCIIFGRNYDPSGIKTPIMPDGIDRRGSCNLLIPDDFHDARRGVLLCNALVQIQKADTDPNLLKNVDLEVAK